MNARRPQRLAKQPGDVVRQFGLPHAPALLPAALVVQRDEAHHRLALDRVGNADGHRLGHQRMRHQRRLELGRAEPLAGHLDGVVTATVYEPVAVTVDAGPVAMHPDPGQRRPVGVLVALGVVPEPLGHAGPGLAQHQFADAAAHRLAFGVDDVCRHAGDRSVEAAGGLRQTGETGEDAAADLGATRVVDDGPAALTDRLEQPQPGRLVPRLAGRAEHADGVDRANLRHGVAAAHQQAHKCRRQTQVGDAMALHDAPQAPGVRVVRRAFAQHDGGAQQQRTEHHPWPHQPAHVGHPHQGVVLAQIEGHHHVLRRLERETAVGVHDPLGLARGARGVGEHQRVGGTEGLDRGRIGRRERQRRVVAQLVVTALFAASVRPAAETVDHHHLPYRFAGVGRGQRIGQHAHRLAATEVSIGAHQHGGCGILHALHDRVGRITREHRHRDGADFRRREQDDGRFRHHRQVDRDAAALARTERAQPGRHAVDLACQLGIGDAPLFAGVAFPADSHLVRMTACVLADDVVDQIEPATDEPAGPHDAVAHVQRLRVGRRPLETDLGHDTVPEERRVALGVFLQLVERTVAMTFNEAGEPRALPLVSRWREYFHDRILFSICQPASHPASAAKKARPRAEQGRANMPGGGSSNAFNCAYLPVPVATSSSTFSDTSVSLTPFGLDFMFDDQLVAWPRLTSMMWPMTGMTAL